MQATQQHLTFFTLGTATWDNAVSMQELDRLVDAKIDIDFKYKQAGGSAINTRLALEAIANANDTAADVWLCTKLGHTGPQNEYKDFVLKVIGDHHLMDAAFMQTDYAVPENHILIGKNGRTVGREKQKVNTPFDETIGSQIISAVAQSNLLILHTRFPHLTEIAAKEAKLRGKKIILDYSEKDPELVSRLGNVVELADYVLAPHDALLQEMDHEDSDLLFDLLVHEYKKPFVAVSNSNQPVKIHSFGHHETIQPESVAAIDLNGAGDTKDAAFGFYIAVGDDPVTAYKKATAIATFSVQFPGRTWVGHLKDHMQNHPLFAQDFAPVPPVNLPELTYTR